MIAFWGQIVYNGVVSVFTDGYGIWKQSGKDECNMASINAFFGYFFSYVILFAVFVALTIAGCFAGIKWRKAKDAKEAAAGERGAGNAAD